MFVCECERASCSEEVRVQSKEGQRSAASGVSCSELIKKHKLATYHIVCVCVPSIKFINYIMSRCIVRGNIFFTLCVIISYENPLVL